MNTLINSIVSDDFLWNAITDHIQSRTRRSRTGFIEIKCPKCRDYKPRCGIKKNADGVGINCYNCGFRTRWKVGGLLGANLKVFLGAMGMTDSELTKLNYRAFQYRSVLKASPDAILLNPEFAIPEFQSIPLPQGARSFSTLAMDSCDDPDFVDAVAYIAGRGDEIFNDHEYFWTPSTKFEMNRRVIIPCYFENTVVGYSARAIDANNPRRYHMEVPSNYLFNSKALMDPKRKYVILAEGIFDAIALGCVGLLGARLNEVQIAWIKSQAKTVIMVPDRDRRGQDMIDIALANKWHVAFPKFGSSRWWEEDIKDGADAVLRYGRLWTLLSIVETATNKHLEINMKRKISKE